MSFEFVPDWISNLSQDSTFLSAKDVGFASKATNLLDKMQLTSLDLILTNKWHDLSAEYLSILEQSLTEFWV